MGKKKINFGWNDAIRQLPTLLKENELVNSSKYPIEMLILKYGNAKKQQESMKKETPLTDPVQHQLLDQNIHIFKEIIEDLRKL